MLICYKKLRFRLVQILYFFCGVLGVHILANCLVDSFWADVLKSMTQKDIDELVNNLDRYFFQHCCIYILSRFYCFLFCRKKSGAVDGG